MKVAVCFSGQARYLCGPQIRMLKKNLLDKYDCDVFCHFWGQEQDLQFLKPKVFCFQKQEIFRDDEFQGIFSMYNSIWRSYKLIPDPFAYDFIIRTRTDIWIDRLPDLYALDKTRIHFPDRTPYFFRDSDYQDLLMNHLFICPPSYDAFSLYKYLGLYLDLCDERIIVKIFKLYDIMKHVQRHSWLQFRVDRIYRGNSVFHEKSYHDLTNYCFFTCIVLFLVVLIKWRLR